MEPYRVFISSIMNRSAEDLHAERQAAREAVEYFAPIATPWAFEAEPASPKPLLNFYIDGVKTSDLFVLIVGQRLTAPVQNECDTARDHGKPMLLFAKSVASREPDADQLLRSANVKYDVFIDAIELREKVRRALGNHILMLIRGNREESFGPGDRFARLRAYVRDRTAVRILPLIPDCQPNSFTVKNVQSDAVTFEKVSSKQSVILPAQCIGDLLNVGPSEPPTMLLNGRLQWITAPKLWKFFPEKPGPNDTTGLGFGKECPPNEPGVPETHRQRCAWIGRADISGFIHRGYEVFYDEDGKYLCSAGQVLLLKPPGTDSRA